MSGFLSPADMFAASPIREGEERAATAASPRVDNAVAERESAAASLRVDAGVAERDAAGAVPRAPAVAEGAAANVVPAVVVDVFVGAAWVIPTH